ncbi:MAG: succinate dehydrogenase, hydrophobic membrane anchor protein [Gammaproteobacteria bacterium]
MSLRSDLGRVKGLGSAKEGVGHWRLQRLTAIAVLPLSLWFVYSLMAVVGAPYEAVVGWIAQPHVTVLLLALVIALFWHLKLGMQVVLEDYIHAPGLQIAAQVLLRAFAGLGALVAVVSILKISVGMN